MRKTKHDCLEKKAKLDLRRGQSLRAHIDDGGKVDQAVLKEMIFSMLHTIENLCHGEITK